LDPEGGFQKVTVIFVVVVVVSSLTRNPHAIGSIKPRDAAQPQSIIEEGVIIVMR